MAAGGMASEICLLVRKGLCRRAFSRFLQSRRSGGEEANETIFSAIIKAVSHSSHAAFLHCLILKKGYADQVYVSAALVALYCRISMVFDARQVFDSMPSKDAVSWNSMVSGYVHNRLFLPAFSLFKDMLSCCCCTIWSFSGAHFFLPTILKACSGFGSCRIGKSVHAYAFKLFLELDEFVAGSTIDMYLKCGSLNSARTVFDSLHSLDVVVWNTMVAGYAQNCREFEAFDLFFLMQRQGVEPNEKTYPSVFKALTVVGIGYGRCFHAKTLKLGFVFDVFVGTSVVDMYSKFFLMEDARKAFDNMEMKNLVSFNALITGYGLVGGNEEALRTFMELKALGFRPDQFTYMGIFSSCSAKCAVSEGSQFHCQVLLFGYDSDTSVGNSIMSFYSKCGMMECANRAFGSIHAPNNISWSGLISCFVENGREEGALKVFSLMHDLSEMIDEFSLSCALKAVGGKDSVDMGRNLHVLVLRRGFQNSVIVGSSLIDMYFKCGMVEEASKVFIEAPEKNVVTWNTMITGYAQNGFFSNALLLFEAMKNEGKIPTSVTFLGVLAACCRAGMIVNAITHYKSMTCEYCIHPSLEHFTCMVTLLGRSGYLREAEAFILSSPLPQDHEIWMSLLTACEMYNDTDIGSRAAKKCMEFYPESSSAYTILSNMYAFKNLWSHVETLRDMINPLVAEKNSGCSWIDIRTGVDT